MVSQLLICAYLVSNVKISSTHNGASPMAETLTVFIDLREAGLDLEPEDMEAYSFQLANELKDGLVEDAVLVRASDLPEGSKTGGAGFDLGILKAEVNLQNIQGLMNWLGERIYGRTLKLEYGDVKLEYRTPQQLEQQLQALEKISSLNLRVVKSEQGKI